MDRRVALMTIAMLTAAASKVHGEYRPPEYFRVIDDAMRAEFEISFNAEITEIRMTYRGESVVVSIQEMFNSLKAG